MSDNSTQGQFAWKSMGRDFAGKFLYQFFLKENQDLRQEMSSRPSQLDEQIESFCESYQSPDEENPVSPLSQESKHFASELIKGCIQHFNDLEETIQKYLRSDWKLEHIEKVDHALLLVGIFEILIQKTPHQVVISESVELAKKYGSADSPAFINGVLDAVATHQ